MSQVSFVSRFRSGQTYMKEWPMRKELAPMFPEVRVIKATGFGIKYMPAVAVVSLALQISFYGQAAFQEITALAPAIMVALFALSMPLQGLWWLGTRASTELTPGLVAWYHELYEKIAQTGQAQEPAPSKLTYLDLAYLLKRAFKQLDRHDFERWF